MAGEKQKPLGMRYTVLTYIFGRYEQVHEIEEKDPEAEYLLITDDPNLKSDTWQVLHHPMPDMSLFARCYQVRFHPFRFAHTPMVVRVDGSIKIKKPLTPIIDEMERGHYDRCMMIHPHRDTMHQEYAEWIRTRDYPQEQAEKCMKMMWRMGYDFKERGMFQGCFEVLRDNTVNRDVNDLTFGLLCTLATNGKIERIDQTITSFVLNRFFAQRINILPVGETIVTDGDLMQWHYHHSTRPIKSTQPIQPMMFNGECEVWKP
jgi:hypothetical protein